MGGGSGKGDLNQEKGKKKGKKKKRPILGAWLQPTGEKVLKGHYATVFCRDENQKERTSSRCLKEKEGEKGNMVKPRQRLSEKALFPSIKGKKRGRVTRCLGSTNQR